jgi:hypothetical protein
MNPPFTKCLAVTPSDDDPILDGSDEIVCRGIQIGQAGDLAFKDKDGNLSVASGLAVDVIHPIRAKQIMDTDTAADDIVVFW